MREDAERTLVPRTQTHLPVKARNSLGVVIEHVRSGAHDGFDCFEIALEIRNQNLDAASGYTLPNGADHHGEEFGAAVFAIIAVHAGDHGEPQAHRSHCFSDARGFVVVHR